MDRVMAVDPEGFGIRVLSERTGVAQPTLRAWESRYGVPSPARLPGGHRRYTEADVAMVLEVVRLRDTGLALPAAVEQAVSERTVAEPSVFAGLRRRHPGLVGRRLTKTSVLALTRAVEDECCAQAERPVLFGAFQTGRYYARSQAKWENLASTASSTVVFADFGGRQRPRRSVTRVHLPPDSVLRREWVLVCESPELPACVSAWEPPGQSGVPERLRRFEVMWSVDPRVVRDAARLCDGLAVALDGADSRLDQLAALPTQPSPDLLRAERLFNRVVDYVDSAWR